MQLALIVTLVLTVGCALLVTTEQAIAALSGIQFKMIEVAGLNGPGPSAADIEYVMAPASGELTAQVFVVVVQPFQLWRVGFPSQLAVSVTAVFTSGFVFVATMMQDTALEFGFAAGSDGCHTTLTTDGGLDCELADAEST